MQNFLLVVTNPVAATYQTTAEKSGLSGLCAQGDMSCLTGIVGSIINIVFSLLGIALFILLIWGGWEWMTSGGENKGVESAKTRIYNAVMGIVITAIAYALAKFVLSLLPRLMG
jgi:hypothetical protein